MSLQIWRRPSDYGGFSPDGDYILASTHRDADTLTSSNWLVLCADMGAEPWDCGEMEGRPPVYTWRAGHWAVGWVEYLAVRADCLEAVGRAQEWADALDDYPIADEAHFSDCCSLREQNVKLAGDKPRWRPDFGGLNISRLTRAARRFIVVVRSANKTRSSQETYHVGGPVSRVARSAG